jgi:tRNA pseudouridine55 synthase
MILLVDKPTWWTSNDVVQYIKNRGPYTKVWHAGTLDPLATWLLIILTDEDTKRMVDLVWHDKTYLATIDLSHISDTWDADYHEIYEEIIPQLIPTIEEVSIALQSFVPRSILPVPSFSAKKKSGRRMYKDARKWVVHDVEKEMEIYEISLISYQFPLVQIRCHVNSGTFIRSIAYTLGKKLYTGGIIAALRRESSGSFLIADAQCIQDVVAKPQKIS